MTGWRAADRLAAAMTGFARRLPPETAHGLGLKALAAFPPALGPGPVASDRLKTRVLGLDFANPVGVAAGFDKDAQVAAAMLGLGFGFAEVGTVTPLAQPGNAGTRVHRFAAQRAVINRLGFPSQGHAPAAKRLDRLPAPGARPGPVWVNIGKNKDQADPVVDYVAGVGRFAHLADALVINVSSPNTPGLRALQAGGALAELIAACLAARAGAGRQPPMLVKIAPDLDASEIDAIARAVLETEEAGAKLDGLIVANTTLDRPDALGPAAKDLQGGLSGAPLKDKALATLRAVRAAVGPDLTLVGCGGIASGRDAYARLKAGASLVQLYTAMVFEGPLVGARVVRELDDLLRADGVVLAEVVGAEA